MDSHSLRVLEFGAVRERLVELASCTLGRERAAEIEPSTDERLIRRRQDETTEAVRLLDLPTGIPFGGIHDIRPAIRVAEVGGILEPSTLLAVADTAAGARKLKTYLLQHRELTPTLAELALRISELPRVEQEINEAISEQGEVRDDASPTLSRLRKELRVIRNRMTDRLNSILRSPGYRDMLQDPVITTRDGRFCIPVKSEYRSAFGGLVHDQSSSGATVFMEPTAVVELGNELRQVEIKERQEVEKILRELTALVGRCAEGLTDTVDTIGELDFIGARGKLSHGMDATAPMINSEGFVGLRRARHPLLKGEVVPIDLDLGRENWTLVITGPNTGGKTVSLKTVGLLALMAQSGLHIPADEGSTLPVFRGVYADIGDEQSIQQSLSTFSGHITNIARILGEVQKTGPRSLVLLDEVGAGTDPTEGGALAKSILGHLHQQHARTIATTHYGELKEFAYSTEGVENASVEFDVKTLRPTYRLMIGIPGASNAFTIAARLGLPEAVVQDARSLIGSDRAQLSDVIEKLTADQRATHSDLRKAAQAARDLEAKRAQAERELQRLKTERADVLNRARNQADEMLRAVRKETERVREDLKRVEKQLRKAETQPGVDPANIQKLRDRLQRVNAQVEKREVKSERAVPAQPAPEPLPQETMRIDTRPPVPGDLVWIAGLNQRGTLIAEPVNGKAQVQIGSMRTTVPEENLQRIMAPARTPSPAAPATAAVAANSRMQARSSISPQVDIRGKRAEEALMELDEYVDDACLAGLSPFRIVHGRGTGALKKVVWEFLQRHPNVSSFRHPSEEDGGSGATIVELRD